MTNDDFLRLEAKVDKLGEAVTKLVLVEERMANQGHRIGNVEQKLMGVSVRIDEIDKKVDQWLNRGIGVWGLAVAAFAVIQYLVK